jgi:hypothetical protein
MRRAQSDGGTGNFSADADCPGQLKGRTATPRFCFNIELPAAGRRLLHGAIHLLESERQFVFANLEIYATVANLYFLQVMSWRYR